MIATWILIGIIAILIIFVWSLYNGLVRVRNQTRNAWAQIDVQLKRRADLIPNLVKTVKGYAKHEKSVLSDVTNARSQLMQAEGASKKAEADNMLSDTLKSLFAVAEAYPDLKANQNFMQLQEELSSTENKVAYARQHYNDMVMKFNNKVEIFPNNVLAGMLNFTKQEQFQVSEADRKNVDINF